MKLKLTIQTTSKYKGSSNLDFFKDLQEGDVIDVTSPFEWPKGNRGHTYAQKDNFN